MRYPEDKIKEAILHPDRDVRDTAVRYFSNSITADQTLMPLAIEAIEKYGRPEACSFTPYLNLLPQTEDTIPWVIAELQRDIQGLLPEDRYLYFLNLSQLLCHTDIRLVAERAAEIVQAPHFDPKERLAFRERLDMVGWSAEKCWNALQKYCETIRHKNEFEDLDLDLGHAVRIVEALARQPHEYQGQIVAILSEQVQDFRHDARKWLQPMMVNLAGEMRLRAAVPLLVGNLGHPHSFLADQSMFALARIGTEEVVTAVCDSFPRQSEDFRLYASELLSKMHSDLTVQRILGLLPGETDLAVRISLCQALLDQFSFEGIEPTRQLIKQHELTPTLRHLRSRLIASARIMEIRFPEFDVWQEEVRNDAFSEQKRTQEMRKLVYEAGGNLGLVVKKLKAEIAQSQTETRRLEAEAKRLKAELAKRKSRQQVPGSIPSQPDRFGFASSGRVHVGRNDPCPCRSGKKFKNCCMKKQNGS